jgi:hypothetical protein
MLIKKMKWAFPVLLVLLIFSSCSEDADLNLNSDESDIELASNFGERGEGQNGGQGGGNATQKNSEILTDWNDLFLKLDRYAYGMRPNATARAIAYINLAAYETAVPKMRDLRSNSQNLDGLEIERQEAPRNFKLELALNACYADVLDHFMLNVSNNVKDEIEELELVKEEELSRGEQQRVIRDSREWGAYVAQTIIVYSQTDLAAEEQILEPQPTSYVPPTGDGFWTFSAEPERALFPYWGTTRTFVISPEETTSVPPVAYNTNPNSNYFAQMQEVNDVNNAAKAEQNDDLWIAEFWSDDVEGLMMSPPGRQVSIANQLVKQKKVNLQESLVLFLKLGFSLNDAAVSTWADKYEHMVMRPNIFIHEFIDDGFQTNLYRLIYWANPSFPGYPSGHSCFSSAASGVFQDAFGNNNRFTDRSHEDRTEFLGKPRSFNTLSDMDKENAYSRIPLGVHVRMDCDEGYRLGYEISDAVNKLKLSRDPS